MSGKKPIRQYIILFLSIFFLCLAVSCFRKKDPQIRKTALDFTIVDIDNNVVDLLRYKGNVVLIVNIATECVLTSQLAGLEKLYETYADKGFVVLGFPSDSFKQESRTDKEIMIFCRDTFLIGFPLFQKIKVKDPGQHELYRFLTESSTNPYFSGIIRWNFEKFLIGRDGHIIGRFAPEIKPEDPELVNAIEQALTQSLHDRNR